MDPLRSASFLAVLLSFLLVGCGSGFDPSTPSPTEAIPVLESRVAENPNSVPDLVRLGRAYREANRLPEALTALESARGLAPEDAGVVAELGLAYEAAERPEEALELYQTVREAGEPAELLEWIEGRIPRVRRQALELAARNAVAREAELSALPPNPGHVAVFPFQFTGVEEEFRPLGRALAEFMVTDLGVTGRLTVLERMRVQLLLDELALAETGRVDPSTAARSGRLLRAENTVVGTVDASATEVALEAAVVDVVRASLSGNPRLEEDGLREVFTAQKRLVLGIHRDLGIELTPAEEERILEYRTRSLEALLAYGRGLMAEDRGDFVEASSQFREAATLDPGFQDASIRASETERASEVATDAPAGVTGEPVAEEVALEGDAGAGEETTAPEAAPEGVGDALGDGLEDLIPDPQVRDAVSEATGREGVGRTSILNIILRRP